MKSTVNYLFSLTVLFQNVLLCTFFFYNGIYAAKRGTELHGCPPYIERVEWAALKVKHTPTTKIIVKTIMIHHAPEIYDCNNKVMCGEAMRTLQEKHIAGNLTDIGYNFCIGGDFRVYEGRGWGKIVGNDQVPKFKKNSLSVCFLGNYNMRELPERMENAFHAFVNCAIFDGYISLDYKVIGHRQYAFTKCPGDKLFALMKRWRRYVSDPKKLVNSTIPTTQKPVKLTYEMLEELYGDSEEEL